MLASNMLNNGQQSYFNPESDIVKQYMNYTPQDNNTQYAYNIYENPKDINNTGYEGYDTNTLANIINKVYADQTEESDANKLFNMNALREAIRRARRA